MQFLSLLLFVPILGGKPQPVRSHLAVVSPLSEFSEQWNDPRYESCNTAALATYMSTQEKDVIWILNMARTSPQLFCETVVKKYAAYSLNDELEATTWYKSLVTTMTTMKPVNMLEPSKECYNSAQCHAYNAGIKGYEGHERQGSCATKEFYNGECCDYSNDEAIDIVMSLLIDENVPSLGHRSICFTPYKSIGVSIQPHKKWVTNAVLDFHF